MSKFAERIETYKAEMTKLGLSYDEDLLTKVTKGCGPSIYNPDSSKVSTSNQVEVDRVKANFLVKKLGLADNDKLDAAIKKVAESLGLSNRNKYRAVFYYLLVVELGQESHYA